MISAFCAYNILFIYYWIHFVNILFWIFDLIKRDWTVHFFSYSDHFMFWYQGKKI